MTPLVQALLILTLGGSLAVKPDFTRSEMTADPREPLEGDIVTFTARLVNSGDEESGETRIDLTLPHEGFLLDVADLEGVMIDREAKRVSGRATLPAGGEHRFTFRILVPRDAGGRLLSPMLRVSNLWKQADSYIHASVEIGTRVASGGVDVAGYRILPAGLATLAVLALFPLLKLFFRGPGTSGAVAAVVFSIGFWVLFAAMAQRDGRSLSAWRETRCRIVDSRLESSTISSSTRTGSGATRSTTSTAYSPLLALEYAVDGHTRYSSGFDTGSRLSVGGLGGALEEASRWPIGRAVPCWYDPAHPDDVVVIRGFGGAYVFALFPVPVVAYGLWVLLGGGRRRHAAPGS
jgi:hypothetical protein